MCGVVAVPPEPSIMVQIWVRSIVTAPMPPAVAIAEGAPIWLPPSVRLRDPPGYTVLPRDSEVPLK
jgi:hypothetical protein